MEDNLGVANKKSKECGLLFFVEWKEMKKMKRKKNIDIKELVEEDLNGWEIIPSSIKYL